MRAAFYYPWYPEQWEAAGHRYTPLLGLYDSGRPEIITAHVNQMQYADIDAGIWSWWGKGSPTDRRFGDALDIAAAYGFKWAVYYEADWNGKASYFWRVKPDLKYLRYNYFSHPAYLKIDGKPVVFVYTPGGTQSTAKKWLTARKDFGLYVSITDYPDWWASGMPFDSWHGYRPASRGFAVQANGRMYAVSISAGFWAAWEPEPRLARNFAEWQYAVSLMKMANPDWELVYFNEHGEGTIIEPSDALCDQYLCSDYLGSLRGG